MIQLNHYLHPFHIMETLSVQDNFQSQYFPAGGEWEDTGYSGAGSFGYYWTTKRNIDAARIIFVSNTSATIYGPSPYKYTGLSVRARQTFQQELVGVTQVIAPMAQCATIGQLLYTFHVVRSS